MWIQKPLCSIQESLATIFWDYLGYSLIRISQISSRGTIKLLVKSCPNCQNMVHVNSRCFDCKQPIQWICYKCQWESNIRDHSSCHKNVVIPKSLFTQKPLAKRHYDHLIVNKSQEVYWWTIRNTVQALT